MRAMRAAGFTWEPRRIGDVQLGVWRLKLRNRPAGGAGTAGAAPRRWILIPGFGDTPLSWMSVLLLLKPFLRSIDEIILLDFPGFQGFLAEEPCFPSLDLMMDSVMDLMDSLRPEIIMGHSLGGWLAAKYAADCGQGLRPRGAGAAKQYRGPRQLILISPSGVFGPDDERQQFEDVFRRAAEQGIEALRPNLFAREPFWFRFLAPEFSRFITREDVVKFLSSVRPEHSVESGIEQIRAEIWLIWGEKDTLVPARWMNRWLEILSQSGNHAPQALWLKKLGHSPQVESPVTTAAALAQILNGYVPHRWGRKLWQTVEVSPSEEALSEGATI